MPRLSPHVSTELRRKAFLSELESAHLTERTLYCPQCGYRIGMAFSDSTGHIRAKCQRCKTVSVLNLAYFRRQRQRSRRIKNSSGR